MAQEPPSERKPPEQRCMYCGQLIECWVALLWHHECRKAHEEYLWKKRVAESLFARGYHLVPGVLGGHGKQQR